MALGRSIRIVYNRFPQLARELQPAANDITKETMAEVLATAQRLCPVDTGTLRASLTVEMEGPGAGVLYTDVSYAKFVNWGTVKMAARPFMEPAIEQSKLGFYAKMRDLESRLE